VAERQRERVEGYIDAGPPRAPGSPPAAAAPSGSTGWFVEPTVFADVDNSMTIAQEEIFGPVLSVIPYDGRRRRRGIANDSPYGLSGSVWGADRCRRRHRPRRSAPAPITVNHFGMAFGAPFGGYKNSGLGRELGPEGVDAYLEKKSISLDPAAG
jgi:aldehyde dehydrogenase (NAD+)